MSIAWAIMLSYFWFLFLSFTFNRWGPRQYIGNTFISSLYHRSSLLPFSLVFVSFKLISVCFSWKIRRSVIEMSPAVAFAHILARILARIRPYIETYYWRAFEMKSDRERLANISVLIGDFWIDSTDAWQYFLFSIISYPNILLSLPCGYESIRDYIWFPSCPFPAIQVLFVVLYIKNLVLNRWE